MVRAQYRPAQACHKIISNSIENLVVAIKALFGTAHELFYFCQTLISKIGEAVFLLSQRHELG
jgi:hypothetical protein